LRRKGEADGRFGVRMALSGPLLFYFLLFVVMIVFRVEGEAGLGLTLSYWLFIGAAQCVYLVPAVALALLRSRRQVAWGLIRGGGIIAVVNLVAWGLGLWIGPR
jgi:hypothetical protein